MKVYYYDLGLLDGKEIDMFLREISEYDFDYEVHGFEAHPDYARSISERFSENERVNIHNLAISDKSEKVKLYLERTGHGNSIYPTKNNIDLEKYVETNAISFTEWISENIYDYKSSFNILRFNIEGAELPLIEQLVQTGISEHIDLYLGAIAGEDIKKVEELKPEYDYYMGLLEENDITIHPYCYTLGNNISLKPTLDKL